jgi:hypothetical protein
MDDVAAFVIVRIVVVVVIGGEANSDERAPTKAVMKLMEAASVERKTVKATSVETAAMEAAKATVETATATVEAATATVEAATATVEAATTTVEAATAAAAVTAAMSRRNAWLNQPDRRQRQQSQYQFPRHASLLHCPRPRVWDTDAIGIFGDDEVSTVN